MSEEVLAWCAGCPCLETCSYLKRDIYCDQISSEKRNEE